jgi:catechol 2,3-dioxygenase-like lactoylglutathione lyase family enzyme
MLKRVDHINVVVSDLEEATAFFLLLGFEVTDKAHLSGDSFARVTGFEKMEANYVSLFFPGAETKLELIQYISPQGSRSTGLGQANQIGLRHIAFAVEDIHAEVERLKADGIRFNSDIQSWERSGKQIVYFYGADGILLELAQYPDE